VRYKEKTKDELISELTKLYQRVAELETLETKRKRIEERLVIENRKLYKVAKRELAGRKKIEEALIKERDLLQALIDNIPDSVYFKDDKNRFIRVNKTKASHAGITPEKMIGKTDFGFFPQKEAKEAFADDNWVMKFNKPLIDKIEKITHIDGSEHWFSITKIPRHNEKGEVIGSMGISRDITELKKGEEELQRSFEKLNKTLQGTIHTLALTVEMRDPYIAGHQRRVTQLACAIAKEMGLAEEQINALRFTGIIHDTGKINVPAEILSKPGRLNEFEFGMIKAHPQLGHDILKGMNFPWPIAKIILQHHERMNGSGYPQGLSGKDIMLEARILGVADVIEAMTSHRPYREALGIDKALEEISQNRSILYDSRVVDVCLKLFNEKRFEFKKSEKSKFVY